jgi:hypothetical protein
MKVLKVGILISKCRPFTEKFREGIKKNTLGK